MLSVRRSRVHCTPPSRRTCPAASQAMLRRVEAENEEKARLGTGKTYDRSIP